MYGEQKKISTLPSMFNKNNISSWQFPYKEKYTLSHCRLHLLVVKSIFNPGNPKTLNHVWA